MEAATTTQQAVPPPRLRDTYNDEVLPQLMEKFGYSTPMRAPRLQKITLNMGLGSSYDTKQREKAIGELATIAGQQPNIRIARKSIASFKLREGMPVGASVTLRGARMWEFLDRLTSIAIPRIRDFRGLKATSFDGRGNYSMGVREQLIFPEIDYDTVDQTHGLDITITTSAPTDYEAFELLLGLGMPFAKEGRPVPEGAEEEVEATEEAAPEASAEEANDGADAAAETENEAAEEASEDEPAVEPNETPAEESPDGAGAETQEGQA
ncbi:MAG: ribosomal protein [Actinomycetota bacterium]|jgi:large subunit ribosomal protein L5|nr:ribosomal protein [Actinomycetota bacterium]